MYGLHEAAVMKKNVKANEFLLDLGTQFGFENLEEATAKALRKQADKRQRVAALLKSNQEAGSSKGNKNKVLKRAPDSGKENYQNKRNRMYCSLSQLAPSSYSDTSDFIRVFYANIQGGLSYKARPLLDMFGNDFDVFVLVETWFDEYNRESYRSWFVTHSPLRPQDQEGVRAGRPHSGIVILARPELKQNVSRIKQCPYSVAVKFDKIVILALYLPPTSLNTTGVQEVLKGHNEMFPDIVVGDLNCHPVNDVSDRSCVITETLCHKWGLKYSQPESGVLRHDHVFVRSKLASKSCLINPIPIKTDHPKGIGVTVAVTVKDRESVGKDIIRFNLHKLQDMKIVALLQSVFASQVQSNWLGDFKQVVHNDNFKEFIENQYEHLLKSITVACEKSIGRKRKKDNAKKPEQQAPQVIESDRKQIHQLAKDFRRGQQVRGNYMIVSQDSDLTALEDVKEFFELRFQDPKEEITIDLPEGPDEDFWEVSKTWFSRASIRQAIVSYNSNKSCGGDGIHTIVLKHLIDTHFVEHLQRLFHLIVLYGYTPKAWNEVITFPLPKVQPENGTVTIDECRPIGLVPMIRRIFEQCLFTFMEDHRETKAKLRCHYSQAGFLRGSSTVAQALVAHDSLVAKRVIHAGFLRGSSTVAQALVAHDSLVAKRVIHVFVDVRHAYDSVLFGVLAEELEQRRLQVTLQKLLGRLYGPYNLSVAINGKTTSKIRAHTGLIQGGKGSPMLWNVYADPLYWSVNTAEETIYPVALGWADDQLLQIRRQEIKDIQYYLDEVSDFYDGRNLEVSHKKCGIILPDDLTEEDKTYFKEITLRGQNVPVVKEYKYLGFIFDKKGINILGTMERLCTKARRSLGALKANGLTWTGYEKLVMFKMFCLSIVLYAAPVVELMRRAEDLSKAVRQREPTDTDKAIEMADDLISEALRWIFKCTSISYVERNLCGLLSTETMFARTTLTLKDQLESPKERTTATLAYQKAVQAGYVKGTRRLIPQLAKPVHSQNLDANLVEVLLAQGKLGAYCVEAARNKTGVCKTLNVRGEEAYRYIQWRRNKPIGIKCPMCSQPLSRTHMKCLIEILGSPPAMLSTIDVSGMSEHQIELIRDMTPLDIVLNKGLYKVFDNVVNGQGWDHRQNQGTRKEEDDEDQLVETLLGECGLEAMIQIESELLQDSVRD
ncbi:hypothetical protein MP638_004274 [Amoeboaphelidium occidentale]|nr:hypothetical protein MP638_004274 [Amoeboaphelidium occidentale]